MCWKVEFNLIYIRNFWWCYHSSFTLLLLWWCTMMNFPFFFSYNVEKTCVKTWALFEFLCQFILIQKLVSQRTTIHSLKMFSNLIGAILFVMSVECVFVYTVVVSELSGILGIDQYEVEFASAGVAWLWNRPKMCNSLFLMMWVRFPLQATSLSHYNNFWDFY